MSPEQQNIYKAVVGKANPILALKVRSGLPLSKAETKDLNAFMTAARQVSNTPKPYGGKEEISPKMQALIDNVVSDKTGRHVIYSNYLEGGLTPIQKQLQAKGIPLAVFTGKQSDKEKKEAVEAYNEGKLRALMISSAGAEGIDLKGTRGIHILEPHWNDNKLEQVIGRGIRFGSHDNMPENERKVTVHRYQSVFPKKFYHTFVGKPDESSDEYLDKLSKKKQVLLNQFLDTLKEEGRRG
jgi:superfamily II DNA or RNA helicase